MGVASTPGRRALADALGDEVDGSPRRRHFATRLNYWNPFSTSETTSCSRTGNPLPDQVPERGLATAVFSWPCWSGTTGA